MVVALLKPLTSGIQDERLIQAPTRGNPDISAVITTVVRAGRFTTEWYRIDFDQQPQFGATVRATLPRRGHLVSRLYLVVQFPDIATPQQQAISTVAARVAAGDPISYAGPYFGWTNSLGHALVTQTGVEIAGAPIDRLDGKLLEVLDEFRTPLEKLRTTDRLLCRTSNGFSATSFGFSSATTTYTPLPFWFAQGDLASALPIDALSLDPVTITVQFNTLDNLYVRSDQQRGGITVLSSINTIPQYTPQGQLKACAPPLSNTPLYYYSTNQVGASTLFQIPGLSMPITLTMGDAYLLAEYIYVDAPEANRLRLGDLSYPITQHYILPPFDTQGVAAARIPLQIPNPTRDLFFYAHRPEADFYNAPFLATRDLTPPRSSTLWWPDATPFVPAFTTYDSEPLRTITLSYEGKLTRYSTDTPALFRSVIPSFEHVKAPYYNRFFYTLSFGTQHGLFGPTTPMGEANFDKLNFIELQLTFQPIRGSLRQTEVPRYTVYTWAETYNVLRVFGGRGGLLFGY
jgi:Major capsid protein N-terminus